MPHIGLDLKDALRGLRRDLGYAITSVGILALTIGATTTTFSIVERRSAEAARVPGVAPTGGAA